MLLLEQEVQSEPTVQKQSLSALIPWFASIEHHVTKFFNRAADRFIFVQMLQADGLDVAWGSSLHVPFP